MTAFTRTPPLHLLGESIKTTSWESKATPKNVWCLLLKLVALFTLLDLFFSSFWFAAVYIFVFVLDAGGFITWTQLPTLAFSCYIIRAGRYKEGQLEELLAIGINVDAAPSTAELLQLAYAQNFANHFEFLSFIFCFYLFLFFFFWFTLRIWHRVCMFFFLLLSCCCFPVFLFYFVSHRHNNNIKYIYVDFGCLFQLLFLFLCFFLLF